MRYSGLASSALALSLLALPASAKDKPLKQPAAIAAVNSSSWAGPYVGVGLGTQSAVRDVDVTNVYNQNILRDMDLALPFNNTGLRGSVYAGYAWQVAPLWVLGLEADIGLSGERADATDLQMFGDTMTAKAVWDASLRGRIGYLLAPSSMIYATAGVAWLHYDHGSVCAEACVITSINSDVGTRSGYTIGAGFETRLRGPWVARAEYRFADYGTARFNASVQDENPPAPLSTADVAVSLQTHTVSFGLSYRFGAEVEAYPSDSFARAPLVTKAPVLTPMATWNGFYLGGGLGLRSTDIELQASNIINSSGNPANSTPSLPFGGTGLRGSLYAGYNWIVAPQWVVGGEAEIGYAQDKASARGGQFQVLDTMDVKTGWDGSLRLRAGYLVTPRVLLYATGGVAWLSYDVVGICSATGSCDQGVESVIQSSGTRWGWTLGAGVDAMLMGSWIARAEYRYADFGTINFPASIQDQAPPTLPITADIAMALKSHQWTFGVAYKF